MRKRIVTFVGSSGKKISDVYFDDEVESHYVHYKHGIEDMGVIQYFSSEEFAERAAEEFAFGEKNGEKVV